MKFPDKSSGISKTRGKIQNTTEQQQQKKIMKIKLKIEGILC